MSFALLLPHLPHVEASRAHYDAMLSLQPTTRLRWHRLATFRHVLKSFI